MEPFSSGLDKLPDSYPSPTDPLTPLGIDPDWARMNRTEAMRLVNQSPLERQNDAWNAAVQNGTPYSPDAKPGAVMGLGAPAKPAATAAPFVAPPGARPTGIPSDADRAAAAEQYPMLSRAPDPLAGTMRAPVPPGSRTPASNSSAQVSPTGGATTAMPGRPVSDDDMVSATPSSPSSLVSVATQPPVKSYGDYGRQALGTMQNTLDAANAAATGMPTEDTESAALETQRAADAAARPNAANYKPSLGRKVLRGLEGAGLGLAEHGVLGAVAGAIKPEMTGASGYNDPTAQYGRDVARSDQTLASDDQQLTSAAARFKAVQDARKAQGGEFRANAVLGKDIVSGAQDLQDADTKSALVPVEQTKADADVQRAQNESPEAKLQLTAMQVAQRRTQGIAQGLRGQNLTLYTLNGKIPDPRQATGEELATGQALRVFQQQYGRQPQTLEELRQVHEAARGGAMGSAGAMLPGSPNGSTGEEFLKTLDPATANAIRATANGDIAMPTASTRSPQAQALRQAVMNYDPTYTDARYHEKQAFKDKGDASAVTGLSTAMEHLDNLSANSKAAGFSPFIGTGVTPTQVRYATDMKLFSQETGKLVKSGVLTEGEYKDLKNSLDSPIQATRDAAIGELTSLMSGKVHAVFQKYKTAVGKDLPVQEFFDQPTQERLQRFGVVNSPAAATKAPTSGFNWSAHPAVQ